MIWKFTQLGVFLRIEREDWTEATAKPYHIIISATHKKRMTDTSELKKKQRKRRQERKDAVLINKQV